MRDVLPSQLILTEPTQAQGEGDSLSPSQLAMDRHSAPFQPALFMKVGTERGSRPSRAAHTQLP